MKSKSLSIVRIRWLALHPYQRISSVPHCGCKEPTKLSRVSKKASLKGRGGIGSCIFAFVPTYPPKQVHSTVDILWMNDEWSRLYANILEHNWSYTIWVKGFLWRCSPILLFVWVSDSFADWASSSKFNVDVLLAILPLGEVLDHIMDPVILYYL